MEQQVRVMGIKGFQDKVEGVLYDFTKVRLEMPVSRNSKTEVGMNMVEAAFGDYSNFQRMKEVKFPCLCAVEMEITAKGFDILSLRPIETKPAAKGA